MFWLQGKHQRKYFWSKCFRILERKLLVHCNPAYILWISKNLKLFSMASLRFGYVLILGDRFPPWPTLWNCWASWGVWLRWLLWLRHLLEHQQHGQVSFSSFVWYSGSKICHRFGERTCDSPLALVTSAADFMASYQPPGLGKVVHVLLQPNFSWSCSKHFKRLCSQVRFVLWTGDDTVHCDDAYSSKDTVGGFSFRWSSSKILVK